jgi:hypothetical protein
MAPTITPAASIGSRNRRLARDFERYARTVAAFRRMAHPTAGHPLRHGYTGVRLDQIPVPLLHKTWLRKCGPVIRWLGTPSE